MASLKAPASDVTVPHLRRGATETVARVFKASKVVAGGEVKAAAVEACVLALREQRERFVAIIEMTKDRLGTLDEDGLERLACVIETCYVDENGETCFNPPDAA